MVLSALACLLALCFWPNPNPIAHHFVGASRSTAACCFWNLVAEEKTPRQTYRIDILRSAKQILLHRIFEDRKLLLLMHCISAITSFQNSPMRQRITARSERYEINPSDHMLYTASVSVSLAQVANKGLPQDIEQKISREDQTVR